MATPKTPPKTPAKPGRAPRKAAATRAKAAAKTPASRNATAVWSIGAIVLAAGAGLFAFFRRGRIAAALEPSEGHVPTDLLDPHRNANDRAIADFRPDMSAPMTPAERAALAPATGPSPSVVADRGAMNSQTAPSG